MNSTLITDGQSLLDVALQELGSVETLFDLADANGLAITDELAAGQVLAVPASAATVVYTVNYLAQRAQRINTGDEATPAPTPAAQRYFSNQFFNPNTYA
jgi:hypothetical protein